MTGRCFICDSQAHHVAGNLKRSEAEKYDMIIIDSRGRTAAKAFFLGSVSDNMSHHAKCPVLIVK